MKKKTPKEPSVPAERQETIRQEIVSLLENTTMSAKELSSYILIPERDIYEHLEHIQRNKRAYPLTMTPAMCNNCSFAFKKRARLKKPGKCPVCRGRLIEDPLFSIKKTP